MHIKTIAKRSINQLLSLMNLRLHRVHRQHVDGAEIFTDICKLLKVNNPVCFDVGANEGQTLIALLRQFSKPTIYAFEPALEPYQKLCSRAWPANIHLVKSAVGSSMEPVTLNKFSKSVFNSTLIPSEDTSNPFVDREIVAREEVPQTSIDQFTDEHSISAIDLLKIDTQGRDLDVLVGASRLLNAKKVRAISVEINFIEMYEGQGSREEIEAYLKGHGYTLVGYYEAARRGGCIAWCTALYAIQPHRGQMHYS